MCSLTSNIAHSATTKSLVSKTEIAEGGLNGTPGTCLDPATDKGGTLISD